MLRSHVGLVSITLDRGTYETFPSLQEALLDSTEPVHNQTGPIYISNVLPGTAHAEVLNTGHHQEVGKISSSWCILY